MIVKHVVVQEKLVESNEEKGKLEKRVTELEEKVTWLEAEREKGGVKLFSKVKGPARAQGGHSMVYHPDLKKAILRCLSKGIEATSIRKTLVFLVEEMESFAPQIPSLPSMNNWRALDLPVHLQSQLAQFVEKATKLTLTMDCSALKVTHMKRIYGLTVNQ